MTRIEKGVIVAIAVLTVFVFFCLWNTKRQIEKAGGVRNVIVQTGKEIKSIKEDISK